MQFDRLAKFAWFVVGWTLLVIVWGAFVRLSFSGDGCGSHWPSCGGDIIPSLADSKQVIEFVHRITSSVIGGPLILALVFFVFRRVRLESGATRSSARTSASSSLDAGTPSPAGPNAGAIRWMGVLALVFTLIEALVGRWLVVANKVAYDKSFDRAVVLGLHLANTFLLVATLVLIACWLSGVKPPRLKGQGAIGWIFGLACVGTLVLGVSGVITSLGDKLFPIETTAQAISGALDTSAHFLVRMRVLHPLIAVSVGVYMVLAMGLVGHLRPGALVSRASKVALHGFGLQICLGLLNKVLGAPTVLSLAHLLVADIIWVAVVVAGCAAFAQDAPIAEASTPHEPQERATWRDYLVLTKPRVVSLLLFTTITAMFAAAEGWPGLGMFLAVSIGGYMAAGAANAINMVIDRDIDATMTRTAKRPTVTQKISSSNALYFALFLAIGSFGLLWSVANLMSAMLALAGLAFYVVIYTLMLKRRTWQNIVIGGAAGAFPPLVGWTAISNELTPMAWLLFGIIFLWTPVHFWALALLIKDEYASANVPMLPVVRGERATVVQIVVYGILTAIISVLPVFIPTGDGPRVAQLYLWTAVVLNVILLAMCVRLFVSTTRPNAKGLFKFSMIYLAVLFLIFAVDCAQTSGGAVSSTQTTLRQGSLLSFGGEDTVVRPKMRSMECVDGPVI